MPTRIRTIAAVLGVLALTIASCSPSTQSSQETAQSPSATADAAPRDVPVAVTPVIATVVAAPVPVLATDGKNHLAYELQLTNMLTQDVTITSVVVLAGDQTLLTLTGDQVGDWTRIIGTQTPTTRIGAKSNGDRVARRRAGQVSGHPHRPDPHRRYRHSETDATADTRHHGREGGTGNRADP